MSYQQHSDHRPLDAETIADVLDHERIDWEDNGASGSIHEFVLTSNCARIYWDMSGWWVIECANPEDGVSVLRTVGDLRKTVK